jgi:hypothetical protein
MGQPIYYNPEAMPFGVTGGSAKEGLGVAVILMVCAGDPKLVRLAQGESQTNRAVFGTYYHMFGRLVPVAEKQEDLFLLARGAYSENDAPVIGDAQDNFFIGANELFEKVFTICPYDFTGNLYICAHACDAPQASTVAFADKFNEVFRSFYPFVGGIFGCDTDVAGNIPHPFDVRWVCASSTKTRFELSLQRFRATLATAPRRSLA